MERLIRVNVADADDNTAIHDVVFDGDAAFSSCIEQEFAGEIRIERLGSETA